MTPERYQAVPKEVRLTYAGAISVLCTCSATADEDTQDSIAAAVEDWCSYTGWTMVRYDNGIVEIEPPVKA